MGLKSVERRLERIVQGTVGRLFGGGLRPVEISHRIGRAMQDSMSVGVRGLPVVANDFDVEMSVDDFEQFADVLDSLERELCDAARERARDEGWTFMGPVKVQIESDSGQRAGQVEVTGRLKEADGAAGMLILTTGEQVVLSETVVTLGRLPECTLTFDDPNVSRNHAEIRPDGTGFLLIDLGSTNGTKVNGVAVTTHRLVDGDRVSLGTTPVDFRIS